MACEDSGLTLRLKHAVSAEHANHSHLLIVVGGPTRERVATTAGAGAGLPQDAGQDAGDPRKTLGTGRAESNREKLIVSQLQDVAPAKRISEFCQSQFLVAR